MEFTGRKKTPFTSLDLSKSNLLGAGDTRLITSNPPQLCEVGAIITPISQMGKLRPRESIHLKEVTWTGGTVTHPWDLVYGDPEPALLLLKNDCGHNTYNRHNANSLLVSSMAESCGVCVLITMEYVYHFSLDSLSSLFAETASFLQAVHTFRLLLTLVGASASFSSQEMGEGRTEKREGRRNWVSSWFEKRLQLLFINTLPPLTKANVLLVLSLTFSPFPGFHGYFFSSDLACVETF